MNLLEASGEPLEFVIGKHGEDLRFLEQLLEFREFQMNYSLAAERDRSAGAVGTGVSNSTDRGHEPL